LHSSGEVLPQIAQGDDLIILILNEAQRPCNDVFPLKVIPEWLLVYYIDIKQSWGHLVEYILFGNILRR
jgi:hypothetical protein